MNEISEYEMNAWSKAVLYLSYGCAYLPAAVIIWGYYIALYLLAGKTDDRLLVLFLLLILEIPAVKLTMWMKDTLLFEKKVRIEELKLKKRLNTIFKIPQAELTLEELQLLRIYNATKTEQSPNLIAVVAILLSLVSFILNAASDFIQYLEKIGSTEVVVDNVVRTLDTQSVALARFEYLALLLPLLLYAIYLLVTPDKTPREKAIREIALKRTKDKSADTSEDAQRLPYEDI